jgi:hypothetical protein
MTPWGPSQQSEQIAPGITYYSTSSHGGYHLSRERMAKFREIFPDFKSFAGGAWFEEDCDWAIVMLAFADLFPAEIVEQALATARSMAPCDPQWQRVVEHLERLGSFAPVTVSGNLLTPIG